MIKSSRFFVQEVKIYLIIGKNLLKAKSTRSAGMPSGSHQDFPEPWVSVLLPSLIAEHDGQLN